MSHVIKTIASQFKKVALTGAALMLSSSLVHAEQVLDYKMALADDGETYQVFMKPSAAPFADVNLTAQVTLKVPHLDGDLGFKATDLQSSVKGVIWIESSRIDAPEEEPLFDYVSFSFLTSDSQALRKFGWEADKEQLMFSFKNVNGCFNEVSIMETDDAFNQQPNSANTNPGNQFTNLGWGGVSENNYRQNYGDEIICPSKT